MTLFDELLTRIDNLPDDGPKPAHGAIMEDVDMFVPYEEAEEATQVMIDALNEITANKVGE